MHFSMVGTISFDVPGKELKITQSWPAFSTFDLIFLHGDAFPWVNSYTSENVNILLGKPCFRWLDFGIIEHHVRSLLSLCDMLLEYSFEPRPNIRALGTAGSVMNIVLSINGCSHTKPSLTRENKID